MQANHESLNKCLTSIHTVLNSPVFSLDATEDSPWKPEFIQLITLVHRVLLLADKAGKRIDFLQGVGVGGKIQDITSLVDWLYTRLPELTAEKPGQLAANRLNRYTNQGWGYFANGCLFLTEFDDELAFFIDDQRIYLNRQIRRAVAEVEQSLTENTGKGAFAVNSRP